MYVITTRVQIQLSAKLWQLDSVPKKVAGKYLTDSSWARSGLPWSSWEFRIYTRRQKLPLYLSLWKEQLSPTPEISTICELFHLDSECLCELPGSCSDLTVRWEWKFLEGIPRFMQLPFFLNNENNDQIYYIPFTVKYFLFQHLWPSLLYFGFSES